MQAFGSPHGIRHRVHPRWSRGTIERAYEQAAAERREARLEAAALRAELEERQREIELARAKGLMSKVKTGLKRLRSNLFTRKG